MITTTHGAVETSEACTSHTQITPSVESISAKVDQTCNAPALGKDQRS